MRIVTGYTGTPHITSNDDQGLLQGIIGNDSYILPVRSKFAYTLISSNELQIGDGEGVLQGVHFRIDPGTTESVTIENGTQGMKRIDLVCVRYEKAVGTGVESVELVVHKGTLAASSPATPTAVTGDILGGDTEAEMALYTVELDGLSVENVTLAAPQAMSLSQFRTDLSVKAGTVSLSQQGSSNYLLVRQSGHVVTLYGYIVGLTFSSSSATQIATISGVSLPANILRTMCQVGANAYSIGTLSYLSIGTAGEISVTTSNTGSSKTVYFNATYIV